MATSCSRGDLDFIRKKLLPRRVVKHWLPREAVKLLSLEGFILKICRFSGHGFVIDLAVLVLRLDLMMLEVFSNLNDFGMLQSFLNLEFSMFIVIISCLHSWKTTHFLIFCLLSLADHPNQSPLWGSKAGLRNLGLCP